MGEISTTQSLLTAAARESARSLDSLIACAITASIGSKWELQMMSGRLVRKCYPDGIEIISLDGEDIMELHPMQSEQAIENGQVKLKLVRPYRLLGKAANKDKSMEPTP